MRQKDTGSNYIKSHKKYIDYRINLIQNYVSSNKHSTPSSLTDIIEYLSSGYTHNNPLADFTDRHLHSALKELKLLISGWDILSDGDVLGYIYQEIQNKTNRNSKGQYFTPNDIVNYLTEKTLSEEIDPASFRILDPSCGSGQFLISFFKKLLPLYRLHGYTDKAALSMIITNNLFGIDTDPVAVKIAAFNLSKISGEPEKSVHIGNFNFLNNSDLPLYDKIFSETKFDIIAGNPPWGIKIDPKDKSYYKENYYSSHSGLNTFTLFIERAFDFVHGHGQISFLIPEAFLNIKTHMSARRFVLSNATIEEISLWGEKFNGVFAPSASILMKKNSIENIARHVVRINSNIKSEIGTERLVPQESFRSTPENIFNINYTKKSVSLITQLNSSDAVYLKGRAKFFLGIVTGNNEKFISNKKTHDMPDPIIIGQDVEQYNINFSDHYFKYDAANLQQVAPQNLYKKRNKILYKFISKKLTFAIDRQGHYSLNNVNGFIPDIPEINEESLLAILNSRVMQYYYDKSFFTVKVLRGNLERLPIKIPSRETQKKLKLLSEKLAISGPKDVTARENIEDIILHLYNIKDRSANFYN